MSSYLEDTSDQRNQIHGILFVAIEQIMFEEEYCDPTAVFDAPEYYFNFP